MAPVASPARPASESRPKVCLRLQSLELGLDAALLLPVASSERPPFPKLLQTLAAAGFCGRGFDAAQTSQLAELEAALQRQAQLHREQQDFYSQVEAHFSEMSQTIQRMKRDYYREIDHLREQLSRSARDPRFKADSVYFFDPDAYRLPCWESIVELLDGMRMKRELLKEELGGDRVRLVPVNMLCQACRRKFQSPEEAAKAYQEDHRDRCVQVGSGHDGESCTAAVSVQTESMPLSEKDLQAQATATWLVGGADLAESFLEEGKRNRKLNRTAAQNNFHSDSRMSDMTVSGSSQAGFLQEPAVSADFKASHMKLQSSSTSVREGELIGQRSTVGEQGSSVDGGSCNLRVHHSSADTGRKHEGREHTPAESLDVSASTCREDNSSNDRADAGQKYEAILIPGAAITGQPMTSKRVRRDVEDASNLPEAGQGKSDQCQQDEMASARSSGSQAKGCVVAVEQAISAGIAGDDGELLPDAERNSEAMKRAKVMADSLEKIFNRQPLQQGRSALGNWRRKQRTRKEQAASLLARQLEALRKHQERFAFSRLKMVLNVKPTLFSADFSQASDCQARSCTPMMPHRRQARPPGRRMAASRRSQSESRLQVCVDEASSERRQGAGTGLPALRAGCLPKEPSSKFSSTFISFGNQAAPLRQRRLVPVQSEARSFTSSLPVCGLATLPQVVGDLGGQRIKGRHLSICSQVAGTAMEHSSLTPVQ